MSIRDVGLILSGFLLGVVVFIVGVTLNKDTAIKVDSSSLTFSQALLDDQEIQDFQEQLAQENYAKVTPVKQPAKREKVLVDNDKKVPSGCDPVYKRPPRYGHQISLKKIAKKMLS